MEIITPSWIIWITTKKGDLVRSVKRREDETDYDETKEVNVNFEKKYAQKDRKWTIDLKYMLSGEVEEAFIEERSPRNRIRRT